MRRILYARFTIPKKDFRNSNQRVNPVLSGMKSSRIQEYAEPVWRRAVREQYDGLEALEPAPLPEPPSADDAGASDDDDAVMLKMETNLGSLMAERDAWDRENSARLAALRRADGDGGTLARHRRHLSDEVAAQRHAIAVRRRDLRRMSERESRKTERERRKRLIRARLDLNRGRRVFDGPVSFHVRVHNISSHHFDPPNAWPTVKPIQDAATNTGIVWDDDDSSCIPVTTFRGGGMMRGGYVIDIVVMDMDGGPVADPFLLPGVVFPDPS